MKGRNTTTTLDKVLKAARAASQFEDDTKGQYWCGVCNRATVECDAEPKSHQYDPQGPCAGMKLRKALREYGIDIPKLSNEELYERGMLTYLPRGWRPKSEV